MTGAPFNAPFSGSYAAEDCLFLLRPLEIAYTSIAEKERLIQTGGKHYSEMVSREEPPGEAYTDLFLALTARYRSRLARDILTLAELIRRTRPQPVTLVSLARAGTPIGALLQRALTRRLGIESRHYSISIIRDRGIDERALAYILQHEQRPAAGVALVDGWTAKGVITRELQRSIKRWNRTQAEQLPTDLFVVSDIGGSADMAATTEDYAIPCGIMNATVSGLVSRSVLNAGIGPHDFHGCVFFEHLHSHDRSRWFLDEIGAALDQAEPMVPAGAAGASHRVVTATYLQRVQQCYGVSDINRIKPGIAEATRVMLRRVPDVLLLRDPDCADVAHLRILARDKGTPIERDTAMPFNAVALIRDIRGAVRAP